MPLLNIKQRKEYQKKYRLKNIDTIRAKDREYKRIYREKYPEKIRECKIKSYHKHREYYRKYSKEYQVKNKERYLQYLFNYRLINKERLKQKRLIYCTTRRKIISQKQYIYKKKKLKTDPYFKLMENLRSRIYCVLKGRIKKSAKTLNLLGVKNISEIKLHLEKQFKNGMTWKNHGKWHIDHIKPCASFDLTCPEQQLRCFNYKNLQPLWAFQNMSKGAKIE